MAHYLVNNYAMRQWSSRSTVLGSSGLPLTGIYLYEGDIRRGQIYFYPDDTELRPPVHHEEEAQILLHFNLCQLPGTLALLESGSIKIFYHDSADAGLSTVRVPPVEEEDDEVITG